MTPHTRPYMDYLQSEARFHRRVSYFFGVLAVLEAMTCWHAMFSSGWAGPVFVLPTALFTAMCVICHRRAAAFARGEWPA